MSYKDDGRFRFIVEDNAGQILTNDLVVTKPKFMRALSGPCNIQFDVDYHEASSEGIDFKPWKQWIHVERQIRGERKIWCSGLVVPSQIDTKTGIMHLEAKGFSGYPKKMPWLENWNPLAIDVFEVVQKIWTHLQSFENGDLGVSVYPAESGMIMLPGYAFDGNIMNLNFFAEFIRAADKQDCGDHIDKLARDTPFDYVEQSAWNDDCSAITKQIFLGYPKAGADQDNLAFFVNENVIEAKPHIETQIDWVSDVIIDGWFPGTEYSNQLTNADLTRYRRVISQDDARVNSNERAAAWAKRKLSRRQTPAYWESIVVDMEHSNAPFGSYDVADRINVRGLMPWVGDVYQQHKILAITVDIDKGVCELVLKAEGAFNYDPIFYQGSISGSTTIALTSSVEVSASLTAPAISKGQALKVGAGFGTFAWAGSAVGAQPNRKLGLSSGTFAWSAYAAGTNTTATTDKLPWRLPHVLNSGPSDKLPYTLPHVLNGNTSDSLPYSLPHLLNEG